MKMNLRNQRPTGSVLMVTLVITSVLGITLASYLSLVGAQNRSVFRSQTWNASIPIVEAGIEDAIVHLNRNCVASDITQTVPNWTADGWTAFEDGYQMTRNLGTNGTSYTVRIITTAPYSQTHPAIVSEGAVPAPFSSLRPQAFFATIGDQTETAPTPTVRRKVRVTTGLDAIFVKGMVAKDTIDLRGNRIATDSFDSADPAHSNNGQYDINKRKDNGDVATNSKLLDSFNVGNADIMGNVSTGPGGLVSVGPNGSVGDFAWVTGGNTGIQPGHSSDDMNVYFQDVKEPFTGGSSAAPPGGNITNVLIILPGNPITSEEVPTNYVTISTNTIESISTNLPSPGTYVGAVTTNSFQTTTTNTQWMTTTSFPTNYVGTITTNTVATTTTAAPAAGTYAGIVTTNTTSQNHGFGNPPAPGTYTTIITNTTPTTSSTYPSAGTYLGTVSTIYSSTNTVSYPAAGTYSGSITTNTVVTSSATYPAAGTYRGSVTTNYDNKGKIIGYTYNEITGYTYNGRLYSYNKISNYTVQEIVSYTYNKISNYSYFGIINVQTDTTITGYKYHRIKDYTYTTTVTKSQTNVTWYDHIFKDEGTDYKFAVLTGNSLVLANVRVWITDNINITGQGGIKIDPSASMKLYSSAPSVNISGKGVINNGGNATNFYYFGLPGNTSLSFGGNAGFTGVIYAPNADFTLGGGGNDTFDFVGASITKTVKMNGHFNFHYDENLGRVGSFRGYVIDSWNEIPLTQAK